MTGLTTEEIAEKLGLDKQDAYNLVRGLLIVNACKKVGTRPGPNGKGKGTNLYAFEANAGAIVDRALQSCFGGAPVAVAEDQTTGYITSIKAQGQAQKSDDKPAVRVVTTPSEAEKKAEEQRRKSSQPGVVWRGPAQESEAVDVDLTDSAESVEAGMNAIYNPLPEEEPPPARCDVFLLSVGVGKLKILSMLRNDLALDLKEATALTSDLPKILCSDQPKEWAEAFQAKLVAAGAAVELRDAQ